MVIAKAGNERKLPPLHNEKEVSFAGSKVDPQNEHILSPVATTEYVCMEKICVVVLQLSRWH